MATKDKKKGPGKAAKEPAKALTLILNTKPIKCRIPGYSKAFQSLSAKHFRDGLTTRKATIRVGEDILEEGKTYSIKAYLAIPLIKSNVLQELEMRR